MLRPGLLKRTNTDRHKGERKKWHRVAMRCRDRLAFKKHQGGRQRASRSWAAQSGVLSGPGSYSIESSHAVTQISEKK